jgi:Lrp/AsnC family leucine-responsive transcriptional regulator
LDSEKLLDETGRRILLALEENARISFTDLGRKVGLTAPAVTERVRLLEKSGVILGYRAQIDAAKLGYGVRALVWLRTSREHYTSVITLARERRVVRECHHLSGDYAFHLQLSGGSVEELEETIAEFRAFGEISTSMILSTPVAKYTT